MGFTKEDLKTGMVCKHRNGNEGMLHRDAMTIIEYFKKETLDEK